jgi:hypothetical protein
MAILSGRLRADRRRRPGPLPGLLRRHQERQLRTLLPRPGVRHVYVPAGDLVVEGVTDDKREQEPFAIAGGTGAYAGARGVLTGTETNTETRFPSKLWGTGGTPPALSPRARAGDTVAFRRPVEPPAA